MFDRVAVDIVIDGADEDDPGGAKDHGECKEAKNEEGDPGEWVNKIGQGHTRDGQEESTQELDDPETKGCADAFAPFLFHQRSGAAEGGQGAHVFVGNDRNDEKGSDAP